MDMYPRTQLEIRAGAYQAPFSRERLTPASTYLK